MTAAADSPDWREVETDRFVIVYQPGDEVARDDSRARAEPIYESFAAAFGAALPMPVTLRLHPTEASFLAANPLVVDEEGVLAGSRRGRREIEIIVPHAEAAGELGLDNALRGEMARLFAVQLSGDRLPDAFLQGVERYMARPGDAQALGVARLRDAWSRNGLHDWSDLVAPGSAYLDPPVSYPESRSIVQYLVDTAGFQTFVAYLVGTADAHDWRQAFESTYDVPPDRLEEQWRSWLPAYLDGGWRRHVLYSPDLSGAEALLGAGDYQAAAERLELAVAMLSDADPDQMMRYESLLGRAEAGSEAVARLSAAATALEAGEYGAAAADGERAAQTFADLGNGAAAGAAREVTSRARLGLEARRALEEARHMPAWRVTEARVRAGQAARGFASLGNDYEADRARDTIAAHDRRLVPAGIGLLAMGLALLAWNLRQRARGRVSAA